MRSGLLLGLLGLVVSGAAWPAAAPVKPDPKAAQDAMMGFLATSDPALIDHIVARARGETEAGALRAPKERRVANVLLTRGITGVHVRALLEPRSMALTGLEAKVPLAAAGRYMTIMLGGEPLGMTFARNLEEKVDLAIGHERFDFIQRAQKLGTSADDRERAAEYRGVALNNEFAVYRLEVIGTRAALFSLLREPQVRAVFVDDDASHAAALEQQQREIAGRFISRGPSIDMGRVDPDKPLPPIPSPPPGKGDRPLY